MGDGLLLTTAEQICSRSLLAANRQYRSGRVTRVRTSVGIFRRGKTDGGKEPEKAAGPDVGQLLLQGHDIMDQTAAAHA